MSNELLWNIDESNMTNTNGVDAIWIMQSTAISNHFVCMSSCKTDTHGPIIHHIDGWIDASGVNLQIDCLYIRLRDFYTCAGCRSVSLADTRLVWVAVEFCDSLIYSVHHLVCGLRCSGFEFTQINGHLTCCMEPRIRINTNTFVNNE